MAAVVFLGGLFLICFIAPASVQQVDVVGDKDGFGIISIIDVPLDGTDIWYLNDDQVQEAEDPGFTDNWIYVQGVGVSDPVITYSHGFDQLNDPVVSATLVIQQAGMANETGTYWDVKVNGVRVGRIGPNNPYNASQLEEFDVPAELIESDNLITLTYRYPDSSVDGFTINFSELTVETPEPASTALLAMGGLALLRKKRA